MLLTDSAIEALNRKIEQRNSPNVFVRLGVKGFGCKGFSYLIEFDDSKPREKDSCFYFNGISVVIDPKSIKYLENCILDWEQTLVSSGFKFINSIEASRCGCGKSFSL